jgi:hypothetical protein
MTIRLKKPRYTFLIVRSPDITDGLETNAGNPPAGIHQDLTLSTATEQSYIEIICFFLPLF